MGLSIFLVSVLAFLRAGSPDAKSVSGTAAEVRDVTAYLSDIANVEDGIAKEPLPANSDRNYFERIKNPRPGNWLTHNGNLNGNRYSELKQIDRTNVGKLAVKRLFAIDHFGLEVTPLAADGAGCVDGAAAIEVPAGAQPVPGGGATRLTGANDPSTDTLFRPTGNPRPDSDDRERGGDNLYANCIPALNPNTGKKDQAVPLRRHLRVEPLASARVARMRFGTAAGSIVVVRFAVRGQERRTSISILN